MVPTRHAITPYDRERLVEGRRVRDRATGRSGVVVDVAQRYVHAEADPIYGYLIRWEDGLVVAIEEAALGHRFGVEVLG